MAKYDPLRARLRMDGREVISMTLRQIARLVGGLPRSASEYREWWANDGYHVQARAWQEAGYVVEAVNRSAVGTVRFRRR